MKNLIYWSPFISNVGTVKSCLNSALAFNKFSKKDFNVKIINVFGEWNDHLDVIKKNNIEVINFFPNLSKFVPSSGYIKSRLAYIFIFLISFFPLLNLLKKEKNSYFIAHLITSLPLFLNLIFNFNCKMILRISGFPKLNILRKFFWKISSKKIFLTTCPTIELKEKLIKTNLFDHSKLKFLPDAIINIEDFLNKKNIKYDIPTKKKFILSVGRLTRQKNYEYLIKEVSFFLKKNLDYDLLIIGDGEDKKKLKNLINDLDLNERIFLLGHIGNPYYFMKKASVFILASLWEEVGFVIVEAALSNLAIISSDCPNGPKEFLGNGSGGYLFKTNIKNSLNKILNDLNYNQFINKRIFAKKNALKYTRFRHHIEFKKLLSF